MSVAQERSYRFQRRIDQNLSSIKEIVIPSDFELVGKYVEQMIATSKKPATISKNLDSIKSLCRVLNPDSANLKEWKSLTRDNINTLVANVMRKYSDNGQESNASYDLKKALMNWFRFVKLGNRLSKKVGTPEELKDIELVPVKNKLTHSDLITHDELSRIITAAMNPRDKALFDFLYDSSCRVGELISIRLKHLSITRDEITVKIPESKTTIREIALLNSRTNLVEWLNVHPDKDNPEAYLFCIINGDNIGQPVTEDSIRSTLKKVCKRAGIKKRIYPHLFRHSSATEFVPKLGVVANDRMGWSSGSKMVSRYVHLNQKQKNEAFYKANGIDVDEAKIEARLNRICPSCRVANSSNDDLCRSCGNPLTLEKRVQFDSDKKDFESKIENQIKTLTDSFSQMQSMMNLFASFLPKETKELPKEIAVPLDSIPIELREQLIQKLNL